MGPENGIADGAADNSEAFRFEGKSFRPEGKGFRPEGKGVLLGGVDIFVGSSDCEACRMSFAQYWGKRLQKKTAMVC